MVRRHQNLQSESWRKNIMCYCQRMKSYNSNVYKRNKAHLKAITLKKARKIIKSCNKKYLPSVSIKTFQLLSLKKKLKNQKKYFGGVINNFLIFLQMVCQTKGRCRGHFGRRGRINRSGSRRQMQRCQTRQTR